MKSAFHTCLLLSALLLTACQGQHIGSKGSPAIVEASCGQCNFQLEGDGCNLAIRTEGHAHFVEGTGIDDHGDAHAQDGFCETVRHAKVRGRLKKDRFHARYFELIPED